MSEKKVVKGGFYVVAYLWFFVGFFANDFSIYFLHRNSHLYFVRTFGSNVITGMRTYAIEIFTRKRPHNEDALGKWQVFTCVVCLLAFDFIFDAEPHIWLYIWIVGYHPFQWTPVSALNSKLNQVFFIDAKHAQKSVHLKSIFIVENGIYLHR